MKVAKITIPKRKTLKMESSPSQPIPDAPVLEGDTSISTMPKKELSELETSLSNFKEKFDLAKLNSYLSSEEEKKKLLVQFDLSSYVPSESSSSPNFTSSCGSSMSSPSPMPDSDNKGTEIVVDPKSIQCRDTDIETESMPQSETKSDEPVTTVKRVKITIPKKKPKKKETQPEPLGEKPKKVVDAEPIKKETTAPAKKAASESTHLDSISFTTYIEFDLHGTDPNIRNHFDFLPLIRDALFSALEQKVDMILFIPGKGNHSKQFPVLRPLVLLVCTRLHFTSFVDEHNRGVVICLIDSYNKNMEYLGSGDPTHPKDMTNEEKNKLLRDIGIFQDSKYTEETAVQQLTHWDASIQAVRQTFPEMPLTCCEIIGALRTPDEAVRYARQFEKMLDLRHVPHGNANQYDNIREQHAKIMRMTKSFEKKFPQIDKEIIRRVIEESLEKGIKEKKMESLLREINSLSVENRDTFTEFAIYSENETVSSLLSIFKKNNFDVSRVQVELLAVSRYQGNLALNVLKVNPVVTALRDDGRPKFLPSIEIDLTKSSDAKAKRSIERIMDGLADGNFSEMVLLFPLTNAKCHRPVILDFVDQIASSYSLTVKTRIERKNRYHFSIQRQNESDGDDEEDYDDEFDAADLSTSLYTSYRFQDS